MKAACANYAVIAANTSLQDFTFVNPQDGYQNQVVSGVLCSVTTEHVQLNITYKGRIIASYDCSVFGKMTEPLPIDFTIEAQQNAHFQFTDNTGTGVTSAALTLIYDVASRPV